MKFVLFYHSLVSDWNHGNAHFLRGVSTELVSRGHEVSVYEPAASWSITNLVFEHGKKPIEDFRSAYPSLKENFYRLEALDLDRVLDGADVVIVHEWNDHELIRRIGEFRKSNGGFVLFFHDTHHRTVTSPEEMARYDLSGYDGALAYGEVIRNIYIERGLAQRAWTWHEAADINVFKPLESENEGDLVWVGNWGDDERTAELDEFLFSPVKRLGLKAAIHGVRYPDEALSKLRECAIDFRGWLPNFKAPGVFARHTVTVHVPRSPYARSLPGIPTIRVFEALACGIPLVSAPWEDSEGLFNPGKDFLLAKNGTEMERMLIEIIYDKAMREELIKSGLDTIRSRHTCAHRVDELFGICLKAGAAEGLCVR